MGRATAERRGQCGPAKNDRISRYPRPSAPMISLLLPPRLFTYVHGPLLTLASLLRAGLITSMLL